MNRDFERQFNTSMDELHFSDEAKYRMIINLCLNEGAKERKKKMNKFSVKAAIIAAAAAVMCIGGTVYAAGNIVSIVSGSSSIGDYHKFSDLEKAEEKVGFNVSAVESFSNGFEFKNISIADTSGLDEEGNKLKSWKELDILYDNEDKLVFVNMEPVGITGEAFEGDSGDTDTSVINGLDVHYNYTEMLFLPGNYEEDEDLKAQFAEDFKRQDTDDHFWISYGSDEAERKYFESVRFAKDGIKYLISSYDGVGKDDLYLMAEEIINAE